MADYWTNASFYVELPEPAIAHLETLFNEFDEMKDDEDLYVDFNFERRHEGVGEGMGRLWVSNDESINVNTAVDLIQRTLDKFDLPDVVTFAWSDDCSKPRIDAFGGGAVAIHKDRIDYMNTHSWMDDHAKLMAEELNGAGT